jgi:hypothetical protein
MESMRVSWTDDRLDDLAHRMDEGFRRVDADNRELRAEMGAFRAEMNDGFESLQRTMIQFGGCLIASFAALVVAFLLGGH